MSWRVQQETESMPSEVCHLGKPVKGRMRSRASAKVGMNDLREGFDYGNNSPSRAKRQKCSTAETWTHVRRLLSHELKGETTADGLTENTHICILCDMLLKLTQTKASSGERAAWQSSVACKHLNSSHAEDTSDAQNQEAQRFSSMESAGGTYHFQVPAADRALSCALRVKATLTRRAVLSGFRDVM